MKAKKKEKLKIKKKEALIRKFKLLDDPVRTLKREKIQRNQKESTVATTN